MGNDKNLKIKTFQLGNFIRKARDEDDFGVSANIADFMELKLLRKKQLVIEWARIPDRETMLTERTKIESDIDDIVSAHLNGSILSVVLKQAPTVQNGVQPWDKDKQQRGRCRWLGEDSGPLEIKNAAMQSRTMIVELGNTVAKIRKTVSILLNGGFLGSNVSAQDVTTSPDKSPKSVAAAVSAPAALSNGTVSESMAPAAARLPAVASSNSGHDFVNLNNSVGIGNVGGNSSGMNAKANMHGINLKPGGEAMMVTASFQYNGSVHGDPFHKYHGQSDAHHNHHLEPFGEHDDVRHHLSLAPPSVKRMRYDSDGSLASSTSSSYDDADDDDGQPSPETEHIGDTTNDDEDVKCAECGVDVDGKTVTNIHGMACPHCTTRCSACRPVACSKGSCNSRGCDLCMAKFSCGHGPFCRSCFSDREVRDLCEYCGHTRCKSCFSDKANACDCNSSWEVIQSYSEDVMEGHENFWDSPNIEAQAV